MVLRANPRVDTRDRGADRRESARRRVAASIIALGIALALAGCAEPGSGVESAQIDPNAKATTTTTVPSTSTTVAATTTTTSTTAPSTTTTTAPEDVPEPAIITGTFFEDGEVIQNDLPDGAIGPAEHVVGTYRESLTEALGVGTYRIRAEFVVGWAWPETEEYVVEVDVTEDPDSGVNASHERWIIPDPITGDLAGTYQIITIGDQRFAYDPNDGEWRDVGIPSDLVGPMLMAPTGYPWLGQFATYVSAVGWLGNDEIDGVPVGHYEIPPYPTDVDNPRHLESDWDSDVEFWIDADGIVRRYKTVAYLNGDFYQSDNTLLYDVGADITIEPPIP